MPIVIFKDHIIAWVIGANLRQLLQGHGFFAAGGIDIFCGTGYGVARGLNPSHSFCS